MERSENMKTIKSKDTAAELVVMRVVYALGYRFRLHKLDLPGKPDLALDVRRKVILVHGCFSHGHNYPCEAQTLETNADYWHFKIARNCKLRARRKRHRSSGPAQLAYLYLLGSVS